MSTMLTIIRDVTVSLKSKSAKQPIVNRVSFEIPKNSIVSLVGGSGSGKTTMGLAILGLLDPALSITEGKIVYRGKDLRELSKKKMRELRGSEISMVFQEPLNAFNPVFSLGYQIDEVLRFHTKLSTKLRAVKVLDLLDTVGIPDPERIASQYPHQLSGGLRQRAMIAQAIAAEPKLIIADEPTSNLDVTLQARIIELFQELKSKLSLSILLITHDLGMVKHMADSVNVMHQGKIVEKGQTNAVLENPQHDYTK